MKIALGTVNQTPLDWDNNITNILSSINEAKTQQVDLLLLPELCLTAYGCEDLYYNQWFLNQALDLFFDHILPQTKSIAISVGLPVFFQNKLFNASFFVSNQELKAIVCKQHLAKDGVHYEPRWFTEWQANTVAEIELRNKKYPIGDLVIDFQGYKIGYEICEDAWQEETRPAHNLQNRGVDLILNPSASHFSFGKSKLREDLVKSSSSKFNCYYAYANLLGNEAGRIIYDGELLLAKNGELLLRNEILSFEKVQLLVSEIDLITNSIAVDNSKIASQLSKEEEFLKATTLGLWDYLNKSKSKGFVLSLSGGADSATCAVLVAEMSKRAISLLGKEAFEEKFSKEGKKILTCAYQSTRNSGYTTFNAAKSLATELGATFFQLSIDEEVNSFTEKISNVLGRTLNWTYDDIALQNIQARGRAPMVWMLANVLGALLITTSNRSEGDVGYATMDGDMAGSLAPIAGVDKHFIQHWLRWAEKELNYKSLTLVNNKQPTAELRPNSENQTDEKDLMPYVLLQDIERLAIESHLSPEEILIKLSEREAYQNLDLKNYINKFFRMWSINQWKRERTAPSFLLDTFSVDPKSYYRFPILNGGFSVIK